MISLYLSRVVRSSSELRNPELKTTLKPPQQARSNGLTICTLICTKIVILTITKDRPQAELKRSREKRDARVRECAKIARRVRVKVRQRL